MYPPHLSNRELLMMLVKLSIRNYVMVPVLRAVLWLSDVTKTPL